MTSTTPRWASNEDEQRPHHDEAQLRPAAQGHPLDFATWSWAVGPRCRAYGAADRSADAAAAQQRRRADASCCAGGTESP